MFVHGADLEDISIERVSQEAVKASENSILSDRTRLGHLKVEATVISTLLEVASYDRSAPKTLLKQSGRYSKRQE